jgi:hypothetical protein
MDGEERVEINGKWKMENGREKRKGWGQNEE